MTIYIANQNGDWWEHPNGDLLFVLDTDTLDKKTFKNILEDYELAGDSWEDVIYEYGKELPLHV